MKTTIQLSIFCIIFAFTSTSSFAQLESGPTRTIGFKIGYTDAWQHYGDVILPANAETHVKGYHGALEFYRSINRFLSVGIEPGLVTRGAACVPGWNGGITPGFIGDTKFFINYIELPVAASLKLPVFKSNFSVFAKVAYGPSYIVSAKQEKICLKCMRPGRGTITPIELGPNSILNRWDHGLYSAAGMSYQLNSHQVFFEYEFYTGFRDAERFNTSKNRDSDFSIGYRFSL
jgi:hypothetical protein